MCVAVAVQVESLTKQLQEREHEASERDKRLAALSEVSKHKHGRTDCSSL